MTKENFYYGMAGASLGLFAVLICTVLHFAMTLEFPYKGGPTNIDSSPAAPAVCQIIKGQVIGHCN